MNNDKYPFTDKNIADAPNSAGVYALFINERTIYIGRSKGGTTTIRSRLRDHKAGREGRCTQKATHYWREVTSSPVTRERQLLESFRRSNGRLPECNDRLG